MLLRFRFSLTVKSSAFEKSNGDDHIFMLIQGENCFKWINMRCNKKYIYTFLKIKMFGFVAEMVLKKHDKIQLIVLAFIIASRKFTVLKHDTHTI